MSKKIKIVILISIFNTSLFASQAFQGVINFRQGDGTQFSGYLKGTSAFHWIESNGEIIKYSRKDKFYHVAVFDKSGDLVVTDRLPKQNSLLRYQSHFSKELQIDNSVRKKLIILYKKRTKGHVPR